MRTDFPSTPLPLPDVKSVASELAHVGGPALIHKDHRRTLFPIITKEDILQMLLAVKSPELMVDQFAREYLAYVDAAFAIPTASGTASLHLALVGAGIEPGDEVIVPAFTFIATAQAVVAAKAVPVFVDIDPRTYCMDPTAAESAIGPRTKALMPVHVHGLPADIAALRGICERHNLKLVEDASHAHSAMWHGSMCGSLGDAAGQSLMADKNFPVGGEGGVAFFRDPSSYERARRFLADTGIDYRMSWIAAAFGSSQLRRLHYYDQIRARNAAYLSRELDTTGLFRPPFIPAGSVHSFNMYRISLNPIAVGLEDLPIWKVKSAAQALLVAEGVPAREWQNQPIPCHLPFKNRIGFGRGTPFRMAERPLNYERGSFPNVLRMLDSTLVLCRELRSPIEYERIKTYALAFKKIAARPDAIRKLATETEYKHPYDTAARLG